MVHNSSNNVPFDVWAAGVLGVGSGLLQTDSSATGSRIVWRIGCEQPEALPAGENCMKSFPCPWDCTEENITLGGTA